MKPPIQGKLYEYENNLMIAHIIVFGIAKSDQLFTS